MQIWEFNGISLKSKKNQCCFNVFSMFCSMFFQCVSSTNIVFSMFFNHFEKTLKKHCSMFFQCFFNVLFSPRKFLNSDGNLWPGLNLWPEIENSDGNLWPGRKSMAGNRILHKSRCLKRILSRACWNPDFERKSRARGWRNPDFGHESHTEFSKIQSLF